MNIAFPDCLYCPSCTDSYTEALAPRNLKNCNHTMCQKCIRSQTLCPLDSAKIDFRKYTLKGFPINKDILQIIKQQAETQQGNFFMNNAEQQFEDRLSRFTAKTTKTVTRKRQKGINQNKQGQICLLHSKIADIICSQDGSLICSNCALFGQHKGHPIEKLTDFIQKLATLTENTLSVFTEIKVKQEDLNKQVVDNYIKDTFAEHRVEAVKNIKNYFNRVIQSVKKAEKSALNALENQIKNKRQNLKNQVFQSLKNIENKATDWFKDVENLGTVMQNVYTMKNIESAIKYFDESKQQSFIAKNGEYLKVQYNSSENMIKQRIDAQIKKTNPHFNQQIFDIVNQLCIFGQTKVKGVTSSQYRVNVLPDQVTPLTFKTVQQKKSDNEQDNLLQGGENSRLVNSFDCKDFQNLIISRNVQQFQLPKIPAVQFTKSPIGIKSPGNCLTNRSSYRASHGFNRTSGSRTKKLDFESNYKNEGTKSRGKSRQRQALSVVNDNKKRRKIQIPQKYRCSLDELKNNSAQIVDFGGAELGDKNIQILCDFISKSTRIKCLKLVRNKITDQIFQLLIDSCVQARLSSINLGQNSLTEKSLQYLQSIELGQLKNITLSLNRINRRNVKQRLDDLQRRGVIISI